MALKVVSSGGTVYISENVIANIAGSAAMECYGLIGMAARKQLKDGIAELIGKENLRRGIEVQQGEDGLQVNLHIIVSYGTKISEVASNVQSKVKYVLQEMLGLQVGSVNVFVQGVRVTG
mgnify:CR=1 FL=1